ncbi:MAG: hypothetical protein HY903_07880 [Deltaproteobacteria bacterium]|nr:hypothetical protein [Deltaproteobacteria bacterium]
MRAAAYVLTVVALFAAAWTARAAGTDQLKIAVPDFQNRTASPSVVLECASRVNAALHGLGVFEITTQDDIRAILAREAEKQLLGCDAAGCLAEIGGALGVDYVLTGVVTAVGETLSVDLRFVNIGKATVENVVHEVVSGKEERRFLDRCGESAEKVVSKLFSAMKGYLTLDCNELEATIKVDGTLWSTMAAGTRLELPFGPHVVEVTKAGFISWRQRVVIQTGQNADRVVTLIPSPDFIAAYESKAFQMRLGAWLATGGAVAAAGAGGYFLLSGNSNFAEFQLHQQTLQNDPADINARQRAEDLRSQTERADTAALISGAVSAALTSVAAWLWLAGDDPSRYERWRTSPTPSGVAPTALGEAH